MSGTSAVPQPTFTTRGFVAPSEQDILAGVKADWNSAFGGNLNMDDATPQGQLAVSETAIIGDAQAQFVYYTNQVDPAYASGRMQDAIARIYFLTRKPATSTVVLLECRGLTGVVIPLDAAVQSIDGNLYLSTVAATIPVGGVVVVPFACAATGPVVCPAGTVNVIYQAIPGWDSAINPDDGIVGSAVESRTEFEARRSASVALNSVGILSALEGAVLQVDNVVDAYVTENYTGGTVTVGGVPLVAHSLYVCVAGGLEAEVAKAIFTKKPPGCNMNGNTTVTVYDDQSGYEPPLPSYQITFEVPDTVPIKFAVDLQNNPAVPANAVQLVQQAVLAAFAGSDGGPRARIGSELFASRFYAPIVALGPWVQIVRVELGKAATPDQNTILMNINEAPVCSAADITVAIT